MIYSKTTIIYEIFQEMDFDSQNILDGAEHGGCLMFDELYREFTSTNSMNPMKTYLAGRYDYYDYYEKGFSLLRDAIKPWRFNKNTDLFDYFPDKYNYYLDHDHYFYYYYPVRVEKINQNQYLVDIETSDILTRYSAEIIYYQIITNFNAEFQNIMEDLTNIEEYPEKMDIIIRINNNSMNKGMILDQSMGSVLYPELAKGIWEGAGGSLLTHITTDSGLRAKSWQPDFEIPWYPNEEAQKLLELYFTYAKEAFDSDSYFSFKETINRVVKELNMDQKDARNIVYSYYLYCNFGFRDNFNGVD